MSEELGPFQELDQITFHRHCYMPKPSLHPSKTNCILIGVSQERKPAIFQYNLNNNKMEIIASYDDLDESETFDYLINHNQFLDTKNNQLYLFRAGFLITYDINDKTFNKKPADTVCVDSYNCNCIDIRSSGLDEIHILRHSEHFKFDCNSQGFTVLHTNYSEEVSFSSKWSIYNPIKRQLMAFGDDKIWTCNIEGIPNQTKYEWQLCETLKMPHPSGKFYVSLIRDIVLVFYWYFWDGIETDSIQHRKSDIWCLDLFDDKWYKSEHKLPDAMVNFEYVIPTKNSNDIHFLKFGYGHHFKVNAHHLLSNEFIESRKDYYKSLVNGYIKQQEQNCKIRNIPVPLKQLISEFIPVIDTN